LEYYKQWIGLYKQDTIQEAALLKYVMASKRVEKPAPEFKRVNI